MKLDSLFNPRSVAVIGASRDEQSVGYGVLKSLVDGGVFRSEHNKPFSGKIYAVNPNADSILGIKCNARITEIKEDIDLAVICVPAKIVPAVVKECAHKKVKGVIVMSAGFSETGEDGKKLQQEIVKTASEANLPLVGPNCLGIIRPKSCLNASFAPCMPPEGKIAFVSQSGALADSIIDWALDNQYGFSAIISYGNKAMLDSADFIEWLADDEETKAIALYIEGVSDGRRFMEIAKKASRKKPIIALKAGKTEKGTGAISSHTGSLAGSYEIYKAAFKQSGVINAETVEELFDVAKALANQPACRENSVAIITNGGGCGVMEADYCSELGVNLAKLKESTLKKLDSSKKMHPAYSRSNPLDIIGDALPERYETAINTLLSEDNVSGLIVIQTLQTMTKPDDDARAVAEASKKFPHKPIVCVFLGGEFSSSSMRILEENSVPNYNDLRKAAVAMKALITRNEQLRSG